MTPADLDRISRATVKRSATNEEWQSADEEWQRAILVARESGATLEAIAQAAGVTRQRVWQIVGRNSAAVTTSEPTATKGRYRDLTPSDTENSYGY